jgi:hypothetical protein
MSEPTRRRLPNLGETKAERDYIRITHLDRVEMAKEILRWITPECDPLNVPTEEYRQVFTILNGWEERLRR